MANPLAAQTRKGPTSEKNRGYDKIQDLCQVTYQFPDLYQIWGL